VDCWLEFGDELVYVMVPFECFVDVDAEEFDCIFMHDWNVVDSEGDVVLEVCEVSEGGFGDVWY
jgi:hypothetical protein